MKQNQRFGATENPRVGGSIPPLGTTSPPTVININDRYCFDVAQPACRL
jgi:hypothetical protein